MENKERKHILLQYPLWELSLDQLHNIVSAAQEAVEDMGLKVIAIPESFQWLELTKEELIQVRNILDWAIGLKEDKGEQS